jgi:hypothetical protein
MKRNLNYLSRAFAAIAMSIWLSSPAMAALYATGGGIGSLSGLVYR